MADTAVSVSSEETGPGEPLPGESRRAGAGARSTRPGGTPRRTTRAHDGGLSHVRRGSDPGSKSITRPRGWAVLAVALALMALVAALTRPAPGAGLPAAPAGSAPAGNGTGGGDRPMTGSSVVTAARGHSIRPRTQPQATPTSAPPGASAPPGTTSGTAPPVGVPTANHGSTDAGSPGSSGQGSRNPGVGTSTSAPTGTNPPGASAPAPVTSTSVPASTSTTTSTSVVIGTTGSSSTTSASTVPGPSPGPENFGSGTVSATWTVAGGGPLQATLTWSGTVLLTLSVTCSSVTKTARGSSPLVVSLSHAPAGTCRVAVAKPTGGGPISYTLAIDPPPAGAG